MGYVGRQRYIEIYLVTANGVPITNRVISAFNIYFTRNMVACTDALTMHEIGNGLYVLTYMPSTEGHDFLQVVDSVTNTRFTNTEEIYDTASLFGTSAVISLTQDTGGIGSLKPTAPDPTNWTLYIYNSSDWQNGNTSTASALGSSQLDSNNNWLTSPIDVTHGTYHIVIRNLSGSVTVIRAFLEI